MAARAGAVAAPRAAAVAKAAKVARVDAVAATAAAGKTSSLSGQLSGQLSGHASGLVRGRLCSRTARRFNKTVCAIPSFPHSSSKPLTRIESVFLRRSLSSSAPFPSPILPPTLTYSPAIAHSLSLLALSSSSTFSLTLHASLLHPSAGESIQKPPTAHTQRLGCLSRSRENWCRSSSSSSSSSSHKGSCLRGGSGRGHLARGRASGQGGSAATRSAAHAAESETIVARVSNTSSSSSDSGPRSNRGHSSRSSDAGSAFAGRVSGDDTGRVTHSDDDAGDNRSDVSSSASAAATATAPATAAPAVCPGCGILMQDRDPSGPGYFVRPSAPAIATAADEVSALDSGVVDDDFINENDDVSREDYEGGGGESGWVEIDLKKGERRPVSRDAVGFLVEEEDDMDGVLAVHEEEEEEEEGDGEDDWLESEEEEELSPEDVAALAAWDRLWEAEGKRDREEGRSKRRKKMKGVGVLETEGEGEGRKERLVVCARCHALRNYGRVKNESAENLLPDFDFDRIVGQRLRSAYGRRAVVLMVVDAADFDGSFPRAAARILSEAEEAVGEQWRVSGQPGNSFRLVLAANKCDLLPKQVSGIRLEQWIRRRARAGGAPRVSAVHLVSAYTQWGVRQLADSLTALAGPRGDVWVVGAQNAGKSSLINALSRVARENQKKGRKGAGSRGGGGMRQVAPSGSPLAAAVPGQLTEAAVPGTTIGVVGLEGVLGGRTRVMDTPGLLHPHQMTTRLTREEQTLVQPRKQLKPRTFRIGVGQSVLIGGLVRVDVAEASVQSLYLTVWVSAYVPCHMGRTDNADGVMERHVGARLQPPCDLSRLPELGRWEPRTISVSGNQWDRSNVDISVAGVGWLGVGLKGSAALRVWTFDGIAVAVREAMVYDFAHSFERAGFTVGTTAVLTGAAATKAAKKPSKGSRSDLEIEV